MRAPGLAEEREGLLRVGRRLVFIAGWAVQIFVAYFVPLALAMVLATGIEEPAGVFWEAFNYVFFCAIGFVLGFFVSEWIPKSTETGRWVWIGSVAFLLFCVISEMSIGDFDIVTLLFGTGESGWVSGFITSPTMASCFYSLAMAWQHGRRSRHAFSNQLNGP